MSLAGLALTLCLSLAAQERTVPAMSANSPYAFSRTISREVLERYLARSITMEGLLNGKGDLADNTRMLTETGAKFIGRALCLWGGEAGIMANLARAKEQAATLHAADPEMVLQACIFEIVTEQLNGVAVPAWAFEALGLPPETRNFRYEAMLYPNGRFKNHWQPGQSVPDVSQTETKLWFVFLGRSFIDAGCEAIHLGQTELMNHNDPHLDHYAQVLTLLRRYAVDHARRGMVLLDSHVPSGGLLRDGELLMDFHSFPLRIVEVAGKPIEGVLQVGHYDSLFGRSKGGRTYSGWSCEHLPYLAEIDNWGRSPKPGEPGLGGAWIWGYDEISWLAHLSPEARAAWLRYAWDWIRANDPNGYLEMPGSRTLAAPADERHWYHANRRSDATPWGFGDEAAIGGIWAK